MLFLTIGVNGVLAGLNDIGRYAGKSFIEASGIDRDLKWFIEFLPFFELAPIPLEEAIQQIAVSRDEIEWHRLRYGQGGQQGDEEEIRQTLMAEKEEALREYYDSLDGLRARFNRLRQRFAYHFVEAGSGQVYTNLEVLEGNGVRPEAADEMMFVIRYPDQPDGRLTAYDMQSYIPYQEEVMRAAERRQIKQFTGWIGVPKTETVMARYEEYQQHKWYTFGMLGLGAVMLALLAAAGRRLAAMADGGPGGMRTIYRKVPIEIRAIVLLATGILVLVLHRHPILPYDGLTGSNVPAAMVESLYRFLFLALLTAACTMQLCFTFRTQGESIADEWRKSLTVRLYGVVRDAFLSLRVGVQAVLLFFVVFGLGFIMYGALTLGPYEPWLPWVLPIVAVAAALLFYVLRQAGYLNRLLSAARDHAAGRSVGDVPVKGRSVMAELAGHWNRMRQSAEASRANEAKSERFKTELITNVSHDLRTPLTSVISYVDLLKNPGLTEEERASYIAIIDQKSKRLKALIDDLFEATKMASGSVELQRERIDLAQLIEQALAESGAKNGEAGVEFRIRLPEEPVFAIVDGQKMWRVFDNLISNIIRYSLEGTRAYITLGRADGKAEIDFKNVAKYELGDNVDELIERFKRGDASRHTEGSGLGLAIAKSIVDLHGGTFELEVDGDLFKVKVRLPEA